MQYADLSVEEIKRQLEEAASRQAELNRILETRHQEGKEQVIQQIKDIIQQNGYGYEDILPFVAPKRRWGQAAAVPRKRVVNRQYTRYVDPDNPKQVYVRGVLPRWMKQKMQEQGYDPGSKDDREAFKTNSLKPVEG